MLARDREYVLSMLSQLEAVFMNNRVSLKLCDSKSNGSMSPDNE